MSEKDYAVMPLQDYKDICDAVRSGDEKIKSGDIATKITESSGGGSCINPEWTDWRHFSFYNNRNDLVAKLKRTDTANGSAFTEMLYMCTELTGTVDIDVSNGTDFARMFYGCEMLETIGHLDLTKGEAYDASQTFYGCKSLVNISLEPNSFRTSSVDMSSCKKLSKDSITSIIYALDDAVPEYAGLSLTLTMEAIGPAFYGSEATYNEWQTLLVAKPNWTISTI